MYRRLKTRSFLKALSGRKAVTKHGGGKIERRARTALYIGIGIALAIAVVFVIWLFTIATVIQDQLPKLLLAFMIPLIIITFYIVGLLDADEDIYLDKKDDDTDDTKRE